VAAVLLTLAANSMRARLAAPKKGRSADSTAAQLTLTDLPRYARDTLGLFGLNLNTALLAGADLKRLDAIREAADKASCPCLVLIESEPLPFAAQDESRALAAIDRMGRVVTAAHRLGCNAVGVCVEGPDTPDAFETAADRLRRVMQSTERKEVNLLLASYKGLTEQPDRLTELVKRIGGFRIGTFPDFQCASRSADAAQYLRRLTPYAAAVTASSLSFKPGKKAGTFVHEPYDLAEYARTVAAVGYQGTLAIDYRGEDDPETGVKRTKSILESVFGLEVSEE
jgi:sugar phosphate isomerase/epimerase